MCIWSGHLPRLQMKTWGEKKKKRQDLQTAASGLTNYSPEPFRQRSQAPAGRSWWSLRYTQIKPQNRDGGNGSAAASVFHRCPADTSGGFSCKPSLFDYQTLSSCAALLRASLSLWGNFFSGVGAVASHAQLCAGHPAVGTWLARAVPAMAHAAPSRQVTLWNAANLTLWCFGGLFPLNHSPRALFLPGTSDSVAGTAGTCAQVLGPRHRCCLSERSLASRRNISKSFSNQSPHRDVKGRWWHPWGQALASLCTASAHRRTGCRWRWLLVPLSGDLGCSHRPRRGLDSPEVTRFYAEGDGRVWFALQRGKCKRGLKAGCWGWLDKSSSIEFSHRLPNTRFLVWTEKLHIAKGQPSW